MNKQLTDKKIYFFSILTFLLCSIFSIGFYHPDEHFQILEFASSKFNPHVSHLLPWEFSEQIRPTLQPAMVVVMHSFLSVFGKVNPFLLAFLLRLLSFVLCFTSVYLLYQKYLPTLKNDFQRKLFEITSFLSWFVVFNGVRFSSENWSGSIFIIAFVLYFQQVQSSRKHFFIVGLLLGLSILFRYQLIFMCAGFIAWLLFQQKEKFSRLIVMCLGILTMLLVGIGVDRWFYGEWTLTIWKYFSMNILHDKASEFGTSPWYFYFTEFLVKGIPPFSILIMVSFFYFLRYQLKHVITWIIVPFVLVHLIIAHKEIRFLFPIIGFLPLIVTIGSNELLELFSLNNKFQAFFRKLISFGLIVNFIVLSVVCFRPMTTKLYLFHKLYAYSSKPTVLYCLNAQPYLDIQYYRSNQMVVKEITSLDEIKQSDSRQNILLTNSRDTLIGFSSPIFTSYPSWLKSFNFGHWMEKSESYNVYSFKK